MLGAILLDYSRLSEVAELLKPADFSLHKHQLIYGAMLELAAGGKPTDRVTVAEKLAADGKLEAVDGLSYLVSLDDALPHVFELGAYCAILQEKSALRSLIFTGQKMIDHALLGSESAADIVRQSAGSLHDMAVRELRSGLLSAEEIMLAFPQGLQGFLSPHAHPRGFSSGIRSYDRRTGGLRPGELIVIAGRPSMGKTALALGIALHNATKEGKAVAIFSLEMSKESLLARMICAASRTNLHAFLQGRLEPEKRLRLMLAANELSESAVYIDESTSVTITEMHSKLRRLRMEQGRLDLVMIDYLQLMRSDSGAENREKEIAEISRSAKLLAKELGVPVVLLSQLSRAVETRGGDRRPILSDLRDSGAIEADADIVGFLFREEIYKPDRPDLKGLAELIIRKQRNGPTGTCKLVFLGPYAKFEDRWDDSEDDDRGSSVQSSEERDGESQVS